MKKAVTRAKKLGLAAETIRELGDKDLKEVTGGDNGPTWSCGSKCDPTPPP